MTHQAHSGRTDAAGRPELTFWDEVVGIPLDRWMAIRSVDDLAALIRLRDAGELYPVSRDADSDSVHDFVETYVLGATGPVLMCSSCGARSSAG
jgi:hypothetical protein